VSEPANYSVWSVRGQDATADGTTFDAQLLFHDASSIALGAERNGGEAAKNERYYSHPVPFSRALPNRPFTLVVRARGTASVRVSLEQHDSNGPTGNGNWCEGSCAIFVRTSNSMMSSSLPDEPEWVRPRDPATNGG